jgi:acetylornithine deacetylase/succinyl-diaminopimelate desuccinylase-like protein
VMRLKAAAALGAILIAASAAAQTAAPPPAQPLRPDQAEFRALYQELVETNTAFSNGSCTLAAERMAARLRAAGMADSQITLFAPPDRPREGGLVAVYPGSDHRLKPMLLLAHIDVVEARREDWTRDPFTLIEEDGYFFGRGTLDDKSQAAVWTDTLVRFQRSGYRPRRTVKMALTCGEESAVGSLNGAEWLGANRRDLIDAEFALNEGGGGRTEQRGGPPVIQTIQVGEKSPQTFRIETTNVGGHSSVPVRDNAIYQLADAIVKVRALEFPIALNDVTRTFFDRVGAARGGAAGAAMQAIARDPSDAAAAALLDRDRNFHSMLRTTCVATMLDGGHAVNALPQRAGAIINCRVLPGQTADEVREALVAAIGDPGVSVTAAPPFRPVGTAPPLNPNVLGPMERVAARHFPGLLTVPSMSTGGTDAKYLGLVGIPTYGVPGIWADPDLNGIHGLNERVSVQSLYAGRDYLYDLVRELASR